MKLMTLSKNFVGWMLASLVVFASFTYVQPAQAVVGYGGDNVHCTMYSNQDSTLENSATLIWWSSANVVNAELDAAGSVAPKGWWWIDRVEETTEYTLTVETESGEYATCSTTVTVDQEEPVEEVAQAPTCEIVADPNPLPGDATTLMWTSENAVSAKLHPYGSDSYFADVSDAGSWYISGITDARGYSLTVWGVDDQKTTCNVMVDMAYADGDEMEKEKKDKEDKMKEDKEEKDKEDKKDDDDMKQAEKEEKEEEDEMDHDEMREKERTMDDDEMKEVEEDVDAAFAPTCEVSADLSDIADGVVTLMWTSENGEMAKIHPTGSDSYFADVNPNGSWYLSDVTDSRGYSVTVWGEDDMSGSCAVYIDVDDTETVEVVEEDVVPLSCEIVADPDTIAMNGGTTLMWQSEGDVEMAQLSPTDSDSYFASVTQDGSWYIGGITDSRSYTLTVWDAQENRATCDVSLTVS